MACRDEAYARHFGGRGGGDGAVHDALVLNEVECIKESPWDIVKAPLFFGGFD